MSRGPQPWASRDLQIDAGELYLEGILCLPPATESIVVFVHGSGSSRFSPRNRQVADHLNGKGLGTLLFDLLTPEEHQADQLTRRYRFEIDLLAQRLVSALLWMNRQPQLAPLHIGLFGASTGAAAALIAAADCQDLVRAVVSRGGRPDLAGTCLGRVTAPTLLVVGELDREVLALNQDAAGKLQCHHALAVVPGATHLFEEAGALEQVCELAAEWFVRNLCQLRNLEYP